MKTTTALRLIKRAALLLLLSALNPQPSTFAQGTAFTYQGRLMENGAAANGSNDFTFTLYDAATNGGMLELNLVNDLAITNGLFTVTLDFGASVFDGTPRWLQIAVRPGASTGAYTNLDPRQRITATPYAIRALNAGTAGSATTASSVAAGAVGTTAIADGSITSADLNASLLNTTFWKLTGNDFAPGQFIGSTNNQPLELKVGGQRALRLEPRGAGLAPNVLGGYHENTAGSFSGAAIAGGGTSGAINSADGNYSFIGAGIGGRAASFAFVGAGTYNSALGNASIVGSGYANTNRGEMAAVVAGSNNVVALGAYSAFIGGGGGNQAIGAYSTVPGGRLNSAVGNSSFAAGNQAKANHTGAFVWADSTGADFASTGNDQFLIRAAGGVGIGTTNPATALEIRRATAAGPSLRLTGVGGDGAKVGIDLATYDPAAFGVSTAARIEAIDGNWSAGIDFQTKVPGASNNALASRLFIQNGGNVGIGTTMPVSALQVNGAVTASSFNGNAGLPFMLGTTDDQPLEFKVNGIRALRLEPTVDQYPLSSAVNVVGGSPLNSVGAGVLGATIAGGGANLEIAPGVFFPQENKVTQAFGTVGGGLGNTTSGAFATVGGGANNTSSRIQATVGGGAGNTSSGESATVPGGFSNSATSRVSFAAGNRAKANHDGAFVWADSTDTDFASTGSNQFNIRASGGVRLSDDTPNLSFGTTARQMLNLYSTNYGIGVQAATLYFRCDGSPGQPSLAGFRWYRGGSHHDGLGNAGGGTELMSLGTNYLWVNGTLVSTSDRNVKAGFAPVDAREVLAKVAALPITRWHYTNNAATTHLGPMAQDFYAAFGVGPDDKHITTIDESGVALAAIQGLNQKVEGEVTALRAENVELKQRLEKLEQLMNGQDGGAR